MRVAAWALAVALFCDGADAFIVGTPYVAGPTRRGGLQLQSRVHTVQYASGARTLQSAAALPLNRAAERPLAPQWGKDAGDGVAEWRKNLDLKAWGDEVRAVEKSKYRDGQGEEDVKHLNKILNASYVLYAIGLLTAGFAQLPWNPISALCLSTAICARWTMVGHHVSHGGYSKEVGIEHRFHRANFARGPWRRFVDWCDWMQPEAWDVEHNFMHHYWLGEGRDPDLVERNTHHIRNGKFPLFLKFIDVAIIACMWKWYYYAPNTLKEQEGWERQRAKGAEAAALATKPPLFNTGEQPGGYGDVTKPATFRYVWYQALQRNVRPAKRLLQVLGPYLTAHFVLTPGILYALFGPAVAMTALTNLVAAEILTNLHSFAIVVPNHAGQDVYRFETPVKVKSDEFYLRAVIGSANFRTGGDANDFMHGWLNYQIEHHMFPDLSMLSYQRMAPEIRAICHKHGVPYVQENVFKRVWRTAEIGVGLKNMKVWEKGH